MTVVTTQQLTGGVTNVIPVSPSTFLVVWHVAWWLIVKGWHAFEFGFLFWLILRTLGLDRVRLAFGLAASYGLFDELHQVLVKSRGGRLSDVCVDWIGIVVAWYLAAGRHRWPMGRAAKIGAAIALLAAIAALSFWPFGELDAWLGH